MRTTKNIILSILVGLFVFTSCVDMNIPPKNIVTDEALLSNEAGMKIYMARMYSNMPFEDFKYTAQWGIRNNGWLNATGIEGTGEALNRDGICAAFTGEDDAYWGNAFKLLRDANFMLENIKKYESNFAPITYNHFLGEAYFVRATVFYALARRFGGVPLVTKVIAYPAESDKLEVKRSSEKETWDQILADFDQASTLLMNTSLARGYANKHVALAFKSEAMLYAGSVAKYNQTVTGHLTGVGARTGVRVMGFEDTEWKDASIKYFTEAFKAAREVMKTGGYELYKTKWAANNKEAQYQNMVDMFFDLSSKENILVKEYLYPTSTHGYDAYSAPYVFRAPLCSGVNPTLDFIELFDGFPRYADGTLKVTDGNTNAEGNYLMYDKPMDFFANAEPRLRAYVIFPGDMFKGKEIEIRAGIHKGDIPIRPLLNDYSYRNATQNYTLLDIAKNGTLVMSSNSDQGQTIVDIGGGQKMTASGENGPFYDNGEGNLSGFYGRKWLNPDPAFKAREGNSAQPFILMRYAEVLLNAAEAAIELSMEGETTIDNDNLITVATTAINDIRERAGATLLASNLTSDEAGRNIVRKERRKELAFENKIKWDLRRWRVNHYETRDGFWGDDSRKASVYSDNNSYRMRGLYPFYSSKAGKYFFDARFQWLRLKTFSYNIVDYYFEIPRGEVAKSLQIDQQPNR